MADSLGTRVARLIAGGSHALLDRLEDAAPVAVLEQTVRELDRVVDEVRTELGRAAASRHLSQQHLLALNSEHDRLAEGVAQALAEGREDLARPAISRQMDIEVQLPVLESSLVELGVREKELSGYVDALMGKRREMNDTIAQLIAVKEQSRPGLPGATVQAQAGHQVEKIQAAFERTYARQTGLSGMVGARNLNQAVKLKELGDLVRERQLDERIAALKALPPE